MKIMLLLFFGFGICLAAMSEPKETTLYCYDPYGGPVKGDHEANEIRLKVNWLKGERGEEAWSEWEIAADGVIDCEIAVHRPEEVLGDPDMDALGHEVLHCLIGDFHNGT